MPLFRVAVTGPVRARRHARDGTGEWKDFENWLCCPGPLAVFVRHLGWRRGMGHWEAFDLTIDLLPHYLPHLRRPAAATVPDREHGRSWAVAYRWLTSRLDPALLVACLRTGLPDEAIEAIEAHRTGHAPVGEQAVLTLAALRTELPTSRT